MGIDIYLEWDGMDEEEKIAQATGFSITAGDVGYLREAYHGGPYATRILVREAFESDDCRAEIPAAIMRERLTNVTEPACTGANGHDGAAALMAMCQEMGMQVVSGADGNEIKSDTTHPMTVEEAVRERHKRVYNDSPEGIENAVKAYHDFVELAEKKEKQLGKPCTVFASY
jgi:hypothetical protein